MLTAEGSTLASSMFRELQAGHSVEAEEVVGDLVRRAERARVAVPLLSAAYAHLCVYQATRAAGT